MYWKMASSAPGHTGLPLVSNLGLESCKAGQTGNTVLRNGLAHVHQIVVNLTVSMDFTAVVPRFLNKFDLPLILDRTLA